MAVLLNTSLGDIVVDLHTELCPLTSKNFLKLCKIKYYNNCLFHTVQKDFIVQTGDPTGTGSGGDSIYKFLYGEQARFFDDEIHPKLKHDKVGILAMASAGEDLNASQFYLTTRASLDYLDGKHTVFGEIAEGIDTLMRINEAFVDEKGRPYKNIRLKHTYVLDDPFDDPAQLTELIPEKSPELKPPAEGEDVRLEDDWVPMDEQLDAEEIEKSLREKEAQSRAVVLEMVGDIPEAEMKPPENVLFICKLNPVTQEEDLEIIFSRFGKIISADIIRDYKTGDSLCYGFIEFDSKEACEAAYFKMDNVLIDDRRIHVDFSQSVAKLWTRYRRFGTKDTARQEAEGSGCFRCGETGHFAKDCPNDDVKESVKAQGNPKYVLKDTTGQHGDTKYEMLFEDDDDGKESPDRGRKSKGGYMDNRNMPASKRPRNDEDAGDVRGYGLSSNERRDSGRDYCEMDWKERRHIIKDRERRNDSFTHIRSVRETHGEGVQKEKKNKHDGDSFHRTRKETHFRWNEEEPEVQRQRGTKELGMRHSRHREHEQDKDMKVTGKEGGHAYNEDVEVDTSRDRYRYHDKRQTGEYSRYSLEKHHQYKDTDKHEMHSVDNKDYRDRHGRRYSINHVENDLKNKEVRHSSRYNKHVELDIGKRHTDTQKERKTER